MNHGDAEILVARMGQTWTRFIPSEEWYDVMRDLDAGRAGTAFIRLRNSEEHPPTPARYMAAYRAVAGDTNHTPTCRHCDGTGLTGEYGQAISDPCRCPEGTRMNDLRRRIASIPRAADTRPTLGPSGWIASIMHRTDRGDPDAARELLDVPEPLMDRYGGRAREIADEWNRRTA